MGNYTKSQIIDSNAKLYAEIDNFIDDLLSARLNHNKEREALAMSQAEGLLVATQQQLSCVNDWLTSMKESKEIEERAKSFANERWPKEKFKSNDRYRREHYQKSRDTYIAIATEQKAIDIDKACEIYEKELRQMKRILNEVKDGAGDIISVGGSLVQFRKAMLNE